MRAVAAALLLGAVALADDDPVPALLVRLDSAKPAERVRATRALGRIEDTRALEALRRAQGDASEDVRHEAAIALAKAGTADATTVEILVRSLDADDWYGRWQACLGLKAAGKLAEPAVPALAKALGDGTGDVSREAALALATVAPADPRTIVALKAAMESENSDRRSVCYAIGMCGPAAVELVPLLLREVADPRARCRVEAFEAIRRLAASSVAIRDRLLAAADPRVRECGVRGLRGVELGEATPLLERAARDQAPIVRMAVADEAKAMGRDARKLVPSLAPLLADPHRDVREGATAAVAAAGAPALAHLVVYLDGIPRLSRRPGARTDGAVCWWPCLSQRDYRALFEIFSDAEIGLPVRRALSEIPFLDRPQPDLEKSVLEGSGDARMAAMLLLPQMAKDRTSAERALAKAAEDPDVRDAAERALAELMARRQ